MRITVLILIVLLAGALIAAQEPAPATAKPATLPDGVRLPVELRNTLDAKKAKVGDAAKMQLLLALLNNKKEVVIPKGATLLGKVIEAVPRTKENPESRLAIYVERAEWKGGSMPLSAYIESAIKPRPSGGGGGEGGAMGEAGPGRSGGVPAGGGGFSHGQPHDVTLGPLTSSWDDVEFQNVAGKPVLVCQKHNVSLGSGTRFILVQINN